MLQIKWYQIKSTYQMACKKKYFCTSITVVSKLNKWVNDSKYISPVNRKLKNTCYIK